MTTLIETTDPRYFTISSDGLYDRHHYKVVSKNGDTTIVNNWEDAAMMWWNKNVFFHTLKFWINHNQRRVLHDKIII